MESLSVNSRDDAILFGLVPTATPQFKQAYDEAIRQLHRNNSTAATTGKELSAFELPNMLKSTKCELRTYFKVQMGNEKYLEFLNQRDGPSEGCLLRTLREYSNKN